MPVTAYRIVDCSDGNTTVANSLSSLEEARTALHFIQLDHPTHEFEIETYTRYTVQGLGRDPDLH